VLNFDFSTARGETIPPRWIELAFGLVDDSFTGIKAAVLCGVLFYLVERIEAEKASAISSHARAHSDLVASEVTARSLPTASE